MVELSVPKSLLVYKNDDNISSSVNTGAAQLI